jgi:hypothetical protein
MELSIRQRGDSRLLRDLAAIEGLLARRPGASTRLQRELGEPAARSLVARLAAQVARPVPRSGTGLG